MLKFKELWNKHPTIQGDDAPCRTNGEKNFLNQCAIRMGACLASNGVDTLNLVSKDRHCWHHNISSGHVLSAEELARGLDRNPISGLEKKASVDPLSYQKTISGKTGIIFCKNFWKRPGETFRNRSGDHIDLWNGSRLTDWRTWFIISATFNTGGNYGKSKEIWF
ncbi:T6SS effector amidase Tae4 family protein [Thalassomonas sp. RHCl1]|uniref:T6SS effector amidase Tae4 family protein n=1 Tax=Thalassomonas sp. RHCl1 TaxID=2995320 RepID=UPI00248BEFCA|nr:T6SS effector amidase Tae4 family protein [Thalassomonas sp. RHCl1]